VTFFKNLRRFFESMFFKENKTLSPSKTIKHYFGVSKRSKNFFFSRRKKKSKNKEKIHIKKLRPIFWNIIFWWIVFIKKIYSENFLCLLYVYSFIFFFRFWFLLALGLRHFSSKEIFFFCYVVPFR
jgi:hypothetical protein